MFLDKLSRLEQSWHRVTKGAFLPNHIEISPKVYDKKIFLFFSFENPARIPNFLTIFSITQRSFLYWLSDLGDVKC